MKNFIILIGILLSFSTIEASEVSEWFEKESNQFLEIINNNQGTESENYEKYKHFDNKNFAVKSIAYGLIGEKIVNKSSSNPLIQTVCIIVFPLLYFVSKFKFSKFIIINSLNKVEFVLFKI